MNLSMTDDIEQLLDKLQIRKRWWLEYEYLCEFIFLYILYISLSIFVSFDISLIHKYLQLSDDVTIEFIYVIWR